MMEVRLELSDEQVEQIAERVAVLLSDRQTAATNGGYLDTKAAAEYLSCSPGRIHDLVQLGKLHPLRDGRRLLFARADLDAYLEGAA